ncbi:aspartic peptidase domain-containing protein [Massariosphaeria phaeospora]|uniref:Aspartic peptidase domain-containing protein n=1 Tax=Massariosphaeria phaeospora TaxID=100035 RepID=A0A7C8MRN1_9PLEO|nr:aspartic peptidase domain-containing protein [Massariosphaeria phaeospora]
MTTLRLLFLFTFLATITLAVPFPVRKSNISKRSFKVPRNLNTANPRGLNGPDAMRKIFRKYGWVHGGFIAINKDEEGSFLRPKVTAAKETNDTGTVAALPEDNASQFLSPVEIGGQMFNLDFDSGSSDLWVFSTDLPEKAIASHAAFDASKSTTFKKLEGAQFQISYGDGSGAAGTVGTDAVTIGGVTVQNQAIELANAVSRSFVEDTNTDGLVGLAFSNLNTVNDGTQKTPQKTFFDNVMNDLDLPVFTADLDPDGTGVYEFGKIDASKFQGEMAWIPVNASSGFWQIDSAKFSVGNETFTNRAASKAIADTGTSLLLVDQAVAETYYQQVQGAQLDAQVGGFVYPCDAQLPDMAVAIGDSYMARIPGNQITFATVDEANTTCFGGVQGNMGSGMQIYGDVLFKAQFVAFNGGNQSLGFGEKPPR